jgi:hypothetical protein
LLSGKVARQDLIGINHFRRTGSTIRLVATRRGRPTRAEAKKLDLAVREAAVATFLELGYAGASMEAIAKAAGVTRRPLYRRSPRAAAGRSHASTTDGATVSTASSVVNHITNEAEFFDLDKSKLRMPAVHCEVWAGFIFINLAEDPVPLPSFLGEILLPMETYPFHLMTQRYGFSTRIKGN